MKNIYFIGRDLRPDCEYGTWLAIGENNGTIRVGALLNVSGDKCENPHGRGGLVADYVSNDTTNIDYANIVRNSGLKYNGFNLVLTEIRQAVLLNVFRLIFFDKVINFRLKL